MNRELPEPDILGGARDLSCPSCHAALQERTPIKLGYSHKKVLAIQKQAYEDGLRDAEKRCSYCDGTGDVHGLDGEWRGACHCSAMLTASQKRDE